MKARDRSTLPEQAGTPRAIADRTELAVFAGFLREYVESGAAREELALATANVVRLTEELNLQAVHVVAAVELISGSLLQQSDELARGRAERYREAMTSLLRAIFRNG